MRHKPIVLKKKPEFYPCKNCGTPLAQNFPGRIRKFCNNNRACSLAYEKKRSWKRS